LEKRKVKTTGGGNAPIKNKIMIQYDPPKTSLRTNKKGDSFVVISYNGLDFKEKYFSNFKEATEYQNTLK